MAPRPDVGASAEKISRQRQATEGSIQHSEGRKGIDSGKGGSREKSQRLAIKNFAVPEPTDSVIFALRFPARRSWRGASPRAAAGKQTSEKSRGAERSQGGACTAISSSRHLQRAITSETINISSRWEHSLK